MNYTYDGTFQGLLSVVYERFKRKEYTGTLGKIKSGSLFQGEYIETDLERSDRVFNKVEATAGRGVMPKLFLAFLSEKTGIEDQIFNYIHSTVRSGRSIERVYLNSVANIDKAAMRASREAHKFKGFVRFRKIKDDTYYAIIDPECNVLPLIAEHFTGRFSDQDFVIHDVRREMALVYSSESRSSEISKLTGVSKELLNYEEGSTLLHEEEEGYMDLWRTFFHAVSIEGRKNLKCQRNFMPKKYWKDLVEVNKK